MELIKDVRQWGAVKGLHSTDNSDFQLMYAISEAGELAKAIVKGDIVEIKDAIGDCLVCLIQATTIDGILLEECTDLFINRIRSNSEIMIEFKRFIQGLTNILMSNFKAYVFIMHLRELAWLYDSSLEECLELAYKEIKGRKGSTINGAFYREI
jgi:NTP pyrophosphatase (non-canonical NTP hydrolase)